MRFEALLQNATREQHTNLIFTLERPETFLSHLREASPMERTSARHETQENTHKLEKMINNYHN
jgi:hypothetical protein